MIKCQWKTTIWEYRNCKISRRYEGAIGRGGENRRCSTTDWDYAGNKRKNKETKNISTNRHGVSFILSENCHLCLLLLHFFPSFQSLSLWFSIILRSPLIRKSHKAQTSMKYQLQSQYALTAHASMVMLNAMWEESIIWLIACCLSL